MLATNPPKKEGWEEEFDDYFGHLVLGTLSGDEKSPVFVNNELEVPRLKNFIRTLLAQATEKSDKLVEAIHLYNTDAVKALAQARSEGRNAAVDAILARFPKEDTEENWVAFAQIYKVNDIVEAARNDTSL